MDPKNKTKKVEEPFQGILPQEAHEDSGIRGYLCHNFIRSRLWNLELQSSVSPYASFATFDVRSVNTIF